MAQRPVFCVNDAQPYYRERMTPFEFFSGFAVSQKQKSIASLHEAYLTCHPTSKILEVSGKSKDDLGIRLSAFNLPYILSDGRPATVETAFQSSKVFERGGPYNDLLYGTSREAKKDERLRSSGHLTAFELEGKTFPLFPKTFFYDWLYVSALAKQGDLVGQVIDYDAFTDIEFNPEKSLNCQARSVAIFVSLYKNGLLQTALQSSETFAETVYGAKEPEQMTLL